MADPPDRWTGRAGYMIKRSIQRSIQHAAAGLGTEDPALNPARARWIGRGNPALNPALNPAVEKRENCKMREMGQKGGGMGWWSGSAARRGSDSPIGTLLPSVHQLLSKLNQGQ